MAKILVIGLDEFSREIILYFTQFYHDIFGFDFDADKMNSYNNNHLIVNNSSIALNVLLKNADFIILNIDVSKYDNIFKLSPFIGAQCIITNVNTCKHNYKRVQELLLNKSGNFIPNNFLFFPNKIIINSSENSKIQIIRDMANFYKNANIATEILPLSVNNLVFKLSYQIPLLFDKILLNGTGLFLLSDNISEYNIIYKDIFSNKREIIKDLEEIIETFPRTKSDADILDFLDRNILISAPNIGEFTAIDGNVMLKIFVEKLLIKTYVRKGAESLIDLSHIKFDYPKYDKTFLNAYFIKNKVSLETLAFLAKEKIISLISFMKVEYTSFSSLLRYF